MAYTSEAFKNCTQDFLPSAKFVDCSNSNPGWFIFCYMIVSLCFLVGTPAYLWCLWIYFCTEQKIKGTQVLFLNLTILSLTNCLECAIDILNILIFRNDILFYVLSFFFGLAWIGRPLLYSCICIEKYIAVIHPVTFLRHKSIKYRIIAAVAVWLMSFVYGLYKLYTRYFPDLIYTIVVIITLVVISFCSVSVLCALNHPGPGHTHSTKQTGRDVGNQAKRKAFNTIFSALLLILFTYFPQTFPIIFHSNREDQVLYECTIVPFMNSFNIFGVIFTPLLILYKSGYIKCPKCQK